MVEKKFILLNLEDDAAKKLSGVLGNKTSKKIIDFLANVRESSEKEISQKLSIPINTVEYNLKKLVESGLIEKSKKYFWSTKGKKISLYKASNKSIIISPKPVKKVSSKLKSILPVAIMSLAGAFAIRQYYFLKTTASRLVDNSAVASEKALAAVEIAEENMQAGAADAVSRAEDFLISYPGDIWAWFLAGAIFALVIFALLNWRKL